MKMTWAGAVVAALISISSAQAAIVNANDVNCRAAPSASAKVLIQLSAGQTVPLISPGRSWSYVDPDASPACYVASRYLDGAGSASSVYQPARQSYARSSYSYASPRAKTKRATRTSSYRSSRRGNYRSSRKSRSSAYGSSGSCPCSGYSVCIGPRGGRYCITSGGNKRYGV